MKTVKYWNVLFMLLTTSLLFLQPKIIISQEYTISYTVQDICACDIDLDNDQDLIICSANDGSTPDTLYIFYNDGDGYYSKSAINRTNRIYVHCGNMDEDQYPDIITAGNGSILYIKNYDDGIFGEEIGIAPSEGYRRIDYISDMDGDNLNDMVYSYTSMYTKWGILKNQGDLMFSDHIIFDGGIGGNLFPYLGNLNDDILPDVSLAFTIEGSHVLINIGNLTFDTALLSTYGWPINPICKLNLTPPDDIAIFNTNIDELLLFENQGSGEFVNINTLPLIGPVMPTNITDYNNDGYDDYCYALCWWTGCTDSIYISINNQLWSFYEPKRYYVGPMELFKTESADLNGDNFKDIILYGYSPRNAFKILWNDGSGSFNYENPVGIDENINRSPKINIIASPNPFSTNCRITIKPSIHAGFQISITDLFGRSVIQFNASPNWKDEVLEMNWDGKDKQGNQCSSGIYLMKCAIGNSKYFKKIILVNN